jgi:FKBP-type peptidyl-prolyl cis-trans isomerase 2
LKYTGYANGEVFDSNIEEELKKLNPEAKVKKTVVCVGQGMLVKGLDKDLDGKEIGKDYEIELKPEDAFGERKRELIRIIPLKAFTEKKVNPQPGMVLTLDGALVKIIAVSGARVTTDFNNPLSGKQIKYEYKMVRKVEDIKEKAEALLEILFRFVPEFDVEGEKVVVKGPKQLEVFVKSFGEKFKELIGKELAFEEKAVEKEEEKK